ncbi:MAG TPA: NAD(P)-dependent oxidoreductase, partial [Ramlibacter sp.]
LVRCCLFAPKLGHTIVYGMSDNKDKWWDNGAAAHLGFRAQDSSEQFRSKVETQPPLAADDPARIYQGGAFVKLGPFES